MNGVERKEGEETDDLRQELSPGKDTPKNAGLTALFKDELGTLQ